MGHQDGLAGNQFPWTRNGAPGWTGACGTDPLDQEWGTRLDWRVTISLRPSSRADRRLGTSREPVPLDQEWGPRVDWREWGPRVDWRVTSPPGPGMGPQGGLEGNLTPWTRNGAPGWTRGYHHQAVLKCLSPRDVGELTAEPWWREADGAVVEVLPDEA
ncbi:unnamed protein product [Arctogadus glacialis]